MSEEESIRDVKKRWWKEIFLSKPPSESMSIEEVAWRTKLAHEETLEWIEGAKKWKKPRNRREEKKQLRASHRLMREAIKKVEERWRVEKRWDLDWTDSDDEFVKGLLREFFGEKYKSVAHFNKGVVYYNLEWYDDAIVEYKKAIEIDPNYFDAHNNLGLVYADKEMLDDAITEYKKVIGINPEYTNAHNNLGVAYLDKGMFDEAIAEFKEASEIDPNDADVHNNLAVAYYCKGEYSSAIKYCDNAIELGYEVPHKFLKLLKPHQKNIGKVKREEKNEVDNG